MRRKLLHLAVVLAFVQAQGGADGGTCACLVSFSRHYPRSWALYGLRRREDLIGAGWSEVKVSALGRVRGKTSGAGVKEGLMRLRGGSLRPGTTDYSKWEEVGSEGESEYEENFGPTRVTKLKEPGTVVFGGGDGMTIHGEVEGVRQAERTRWGKKASKKQGWRERCGILEQKDSEEEDVMMPIHASFEDDDDLSPPALYNICIPLSPSPSASPFVTFLHWHDLQRKTSTHALPTSPTVHPPSTPSTHVLQVPPLDPLALEDELFGPAGGVNLNSTQNDQGSMPEFEQGEDLSWGVFGKDKLKGKAHLHEWNPDGGGGKGAWMRERKEATGDGGDSFEAKEGTVGGASKGVDYSKWEDMVVSEADHPSTEEGSQAEVHQDDARVARELRHEIARCRAARDEQGLRRVLKAVDAVSSTGVIGTREVDEARQALWEMVAANGRGAAAEGVGEAFTREAIKAQHGALTRNGGDAACYLWGQDRDTCTVHVWAPNGTRGADVHVRVRERFLGITLHQTDNNTAGPSLSPPVPAVNRTRTSTLLRGKLKHRVRADDGDVLDWEVVDVHDVEGRLRRAVRVVLVKKPPGASFVPPSAPEWDQRYGSGGLWRESLVRVWWPCIFKGDPEIDVRTIPERGGCQKAVELQEMWDDAHEQFKDSVTTMEPVPIQDMVLEDAVEGKVKEAETRLERRGVARGSREWEAVMDKARREGEEAAKGEIERMEKARALRAKEDEAVNEQWRRKVELEVEESTEYDSRGDTVREGTGGLGMWPDPEVYDQVKLREEDAVYGIDDEDDDGSEPPSVVGKGEWTYDELLREGIPADD